LKIAKEYYKQHGKWMSKTELQKLTKGKYPIHSQSIQAVVHKYIWARDSTKKAREQGIPTVRYLYKQKKNFNTKWAKNGFQIYNARPSSSRHLPKTDKRRASWIVRIHRPRRGPAPASSRP
jgi:putative transposase